MVTRVSVAVAMLAASLLLVPDSAFAHDPDGSNSGYLIPRAEVNFIAMAQLAAPQEGSQQEGNQITYDSRGVNHLVRLENESPNNVTVFIEYYMALYHDGGNAVAMKETRPGEPVGCGLGPAGGESARCTILADLVKTLLAESGNHTAGALAALWLAGFPTNQVVADHDHHWSKP